MSVSRLLQPVAVREMHYEKVANWEPFTIKDGHLLTGQNPASSTVAARALIEHLAADA
jgi:putative intracellular protease/amidase